MGKGIRPMAHTDGTLRFDTAMDTSKFQKDAGRLGDIVKGMAVFKILEKGFQAITASIGDAVARYDTLNRFPKIMEQMGYGAENAEASIGKLSDGIQGLPTRLDEIVGVTQRMVLTLGNLDKGTKSALALNNAFYASGATSEAASRGTEQYIQALSKGKPDMMEWRTMLDTMPYAVNQVAEAFGFTGADGVHQFGEALRGGEITMLEFNDKIIELNEGVGGFAEIAQTATGGIGTAWTNLHTRIAAGMAEIIAAIDRGFAETRFKSIENIINTAGSVIRQSLTSLAGAFEFTAKNIVPLTIAVVSFTGVMKAMQLLSLINQFGSLTGAIKAMTPAIATATLAKIKQTGAVIGGTAASVAELVSKKASLAATKLQTAADGGSVIAKVALAVATKVAAAATWVFNAALAANPILLVVIAIAALVAVIVGLIFWLSKGTGEYGKHNRAAKELAKQQKETAKALKESEEAFQANIASVEASSSVNRNLVASLKDAASVMDTSVVKHERMESAVKALNSAVEGLNLSYDKETSLITDLNTMQEISIEQIAALVDAKNTLAEANAWSERANELETEKNDLLRKQQMVMLEMQEIEANEVLSSKEKLKLITKLQNTYNEYGENIEQVQGRINLAVQNSENVNTEAAQAIISDYERQAKAAKDANEAINGARDSEGRNLQQLAKLYKMTTEEILADMAEQGVSMAEWSEKKGELFTKEGQSLQGVASQWGATTDEVIAYMDEMGMTLDEYVAEMEANHTKEGLSLERLADKWGTTSDLILAEMDNMGISMQEWSDAQDSAWADFQKSVDGHTQGVINSFKEIPKKYELTADEMIKVLAKNRERYAEWQAKMTEISSLVSAETLAELEKLGPGANSALDEMLANGGAKLAEFDDMINASVSDSTNYAVKEWNDPTFTGAPSGAFTAAAQQVDQNTALQTSMQNQMEGARDAAETVDFTSVGQSIATDINSGLNNADFSSVTTNIANAIQNGSGGVNSAANAMSTTVQNIFKTMSTQSQNTVSTMMTNINSAIVTRVATIRSSVTALRNAVITELDGMSMRAQNAAITMMANMTAVITSRTAIIRASAVAVADNVVSGFEGMIQGSINVANNMMDAVWTTMHNKAPSLYAKANEIAHNIAKTMSDALEVRSPSRVMIRIFENVMMGIYKAMSGASGTLYKTADNIANNIAARLTVSPDVFGGMFDELRAVTFENPFSAAMPQPAFAGGPGGGVTYVTSLKQDIVSPTPMSPAEITREGQDFIRRAKWRLH